MLSQENRKEKDAKKAHVNFMRSCVLNVIFPEDLALKNCELSLMEILIDHLNKENFKKVYVVCFRANVRSRTICSSRQNVLHCLSETAKVLSVNK